MVFRFFQEHIAVLAKIVATIVLLFDVFHLTVLFPFDGAVWQEGSQLNPAFINYMILLCLIDLAVIIVCVFAIIVFVKAVAATLNALRDLLIPILLQKCKTSRSSRQGMFVAARRSLLVTGMLKVCFTGLVAPICVNHGNEDWDPDDQDLSFYLSSQTLNVTGSPPKSTEASLLETSNLRAYFRQLWKLAIVIQHFPSMSIRGSLARHVKAATHKSYLPRRRSEDSSAGSDSISIRDRALRAMLIADARIRQMANTQSILSSTSFDFSKESNSFVKSGYAFAEDLLGQRPQLSDVAELATPRAVRAFADESAYEFTWEIVSAWLELVRRDGRSVPIQFSDLQHDIHKALNYIPELLSFCELYPLRLFSGSTQLGRIGYYSYNPFEITYVTHFDVSTRGVRKREVELVDRTTPNAIGIEVELFRRVELFLPIFFHEYQHYSGISNEAEVWLREAQFTRSLLNHLRLPTSVNTNVPRWMLEDEIESDAYRGKLNELIDALYGPPLAVVEIQQKTQESIEAIDSMTREMNEKQTWGAEVKFPLISSSREHRRTIKEILTKRFLLPNTLSAEDYKGALARLKASDIQYA